MITDDRHRAGEDGEVKSIITMAREILYKKPLAAPLRMKATRLHSIGQRVVVCNYRVGDHLESWNGETGIVTDISPVCVFIQLDGLPDWISAVGFPPENLLTLKGELAELPQFVKPKKYGKPILWDKRGYVILDKADTLSMLRYIRDHPVKGVHDGAPYNQSRMHNLADRGFITITREQLDLGRIVELTDAGAQHLNCALSAGYIVS